MKMMHTLFSVCIPVGGGTPGISLCDDGEQDQDVAEDADGGDDVHQHQPGTHNVSHNLQFEIINCCTRSVLS